MITTEARKSGPKPKMSPASKTRMERWKQFDPSWMWKRERPTDGAKRENAVIMSRRLE